MLHYKSIKYEIEFTEADKWYPLSKTCSECGYVKNKLLLSEREFRCEGCEVVIEFYNFYLTGKALKEGIRSNNFLLPKGCHLYMEKVAREYILQNIEGYIYL